jgi:hypothetical protein
MRRGNKPDFVYEGDKLVGVCLSSDSCSEHEWGIDAIRGLLGVEPGAEFGIERRRIRKTPQDFLRWHDFKDGSAGFGLQGHYGWEKVEQTAPARSGRRVGPVYKSGPRKGELKYGPSVKGIYEVKGIAAAWDEKSFFVRAAVDSISKLREIWEAILAGDAAIWIAGGGPFGGHGLFIMIVSRIPPEYLSQMAENDREVHEVAEYHASSGIEDLLRAAGKKWFSLKPQRFPNGLRTQRSKPDYVVPPSGGIAWWLNPQDQRNNEAGWYSLEDLQAWARNEGPVISRR